MLVIQLVQDRGSQLHFGLSSLYHSCEIQLWVLVVFLHHSELHRVAFQDDWIASRMKNSAKMLKFDQISRTFVELIKMIRYLRKTVKLYDILIQFWQIFCENACLSKSTGIGKRKDWPETKGKDRR